MTGQTICILIAWALILEFVVLTVGSWGRDKQIWRISKWQMVLMLSVVPAAIILIENSLPVPLFVRFCLISGEMVGMLFLLNITLTPAFVVEMLPILLGTKKNRYTPCFLNRSAHQRNTPAYAHR